MFTPCSCSAAPDAESTSCWPCTSTRRTRRRGAAVLAATLAGDEGARDRPVTPTAALARDSSTRQCVLQSFRLQNALGSPAASNRWQLPSEALNEKERQAAS